MKKSIQSEILVCTLTVVLFMSGCASYSTPAPIETPPDNVASQSVNTLQPNIPLPTPLPLTLAEIEEVAGFDVKEPSYLPTGVAFDFVTYQAPPYPNVILHYKIVHETYGDMGTFFHIVQQPQTETLPNPTACGASGNECEIIQIDNLTVNYRLTTPTELLMWVADGFSFQLLRTAGEPNKIYKDELLKVAVSME